MRKRKLQILIIISAALSTIFIVFTILGLLQLGNDKNLAAVYIAFATLPLAIVIALIPYIITHLNDNSLIENKFFGEHFVDRKDEERQLFDLLENENHIIYVSGNYGMGKTFFAKMMTDRINYDRKLRWKEYAAFYYSYEKKQKLENSISNYFCGCNNAKIIDISKKFNQDARRKKRIIFLDNISAIELDDTVEFAKAFIACNKKNRIVIIVDGEKEQHIVPSEFRNSEIKLLAESFEIDLSDSEINKISESANGYPAYARYTVEAYIRGEELQENENMQNYIERIIFKLSTFESETLSLIIHLSLISKSEISIKHIIGIDNCITKKVLDKLKLLSLINIWNDYIFTNRLIALTCIDFLAEYKNKNYDKIYRYCKSIEQYEYIALSAILESNLSLDYIVIKKMLHNQNKKNNFYLLISLGELEVNGLINLNIREDKECWKLLRYYNLNSLLELGLYKKAKEVVEYYDKDLSTDFGILGPCNNLYFDYNYILADLDHLINLFEDAINTCEALYLKAINDEQRERCKYLQAHCLRHMGENLGLAFNIFIEISNNENSNNYRIKIRSLYSAASIKMFERDYDYQYDEVFYKINSIINQNPQNKIWLPYVNRHRAIYEYKLKYNFGEAERILENTLSLLQVTSLRIKYDILFELGEVNRIRENAEKNYKKSIEYYEEALEFASRVNDFNLESNSLMGIILLNLKYKKNFNNERIYEIIDKTKQLNLNINFNSGVFIKHLITGEKITNELKKYWEKMKYSDLLECASKSKSECYNLKLTVM